MRPKRTEQLQMPGTTLVKSLVAHHRKVLIGVPTLGTIRIEWDIHRRGQVIPINWMSAEVTANHVPPSIVAQGYNVADAQNTIMERLILDKFEWCFRGDTLVEVEGGAKRIRDIRVGDIVKTHRGHWQRVLKTQRRAIPQLTPTLWVRTPYGVTKCTPEHPFLVATSVGPVWRAAQDLAVGTEVLYPCVLKADELAFDIRYSTHGRDGRVGSRRTGAWCGTVSVTRDLARWFGLYLAEGHASPHHVAFTFNNAEKHLIDFVARVGSDVFGRHTTTYRTWATQVRLSIVSLARRMREWFGHPANRKRVPDFVFGWNLLNRLEFLRGYLDGDGSYQGSGCAFGSASRGLIEDVTRLAGTCGLVCARLLVLTQPANTLAGRGGQPFYVSRLGKKSLAKLRDLLTARETPDYLAVSVQAVEAHPLAASLVDSAVYNLEVEHDNSYIADCMAVHNCLLYEDDILPPFDAFVQLDKWMLKRDVPIVSGLFYSRGEPSWPMTFRGRGNGAYFDFMPGKDLVWCDGVATGFLLIHRSIVEWFWKNSPDYALPDGRHVREVFKIPRATWADPETDNYFATMGTSDLAFCDRIIAEKVFAKTGWTSVASKRYPFLVDTRIMCQHVDLATGVRYPAQAKEVLIRRQKGRT